MRMDWAEVLPISQIFKFNMAIGIFLKQENDFHGDLSILSTGFETDDGLETAVLISLFSDSRSTLEQLPPEFTFQRGYWGDMYAENNGDKYGSLLWLYEREKQTVEILSKIDETSRNALQWMIDDGIAKEVDVQASHPRPEFTLLEVKITKPDGNIYAFKTLWDGQRLKRT